MSSWIERRKELVEEVKSMIKKKMDRDSIINALGKRGIARRTALEYYNSAMA